MVFNLFITSIICTTIPVDLHLLQFGSSTWKQKQGMQLAWQNWNEPAKQTFLAFEPRWHHHGGRWIWWSGWTPGVSGFVHGIDPALLLQFGISGAKVSSNFVTCFETQIWKLFKTQFGLFCPCRTTVQLFCRQRTGRMTSLTWTTCRLSWTGISFPMVWRRGGLNLHPCSCITFPHIDGVFWKLKTPTRSRGVRHLF